MAKSFSKKIQEYGYASRQIIKRLNEKKVKLPAEIAQGIETFGQIATLYTENLAQPDLIENMLNAFSSVSEKCSQLNDKKMAELNNFIKDISDDMHTVREGLDTIRTLTEERPDRAYLALDAPVKIDIPTVKECMSLDINNTDCKTFAEKLVGLSHVKGEHDFLAREDSGETSTVYARTYDRLLDQLDVATPDIQARIMSEAIAHGERLTIALNRKYTELGGNPKEAAWINGKNKNSKEDVTKEREILQNLLSTKEYRDFRSYSEFMNSLPFTPMGSIFKAMGGSAKDKNLIKFGNGAMNLENEVTKYGLSKTVVINEIVADVTDSLSDSKYAPNTNEMGQVEKVCEELYTNFILKGSNDKRLNDLSDNLIGLLESKRGNENFQKSDEREQYLSKINSLSKDFLEYSDVLEQRSPDSKEASVLLKAGSILQNYANSIPTCEQSIKLHETRKKRERDFIAGEKHKIEVHERFTNFQKTWTPEQKKRFALIEINNSLSSGSSSKALDEEKIYDILSTNLYSNIQKELSGYRKARLEIGEEFSRICKSLPACDIPENFKELALIGLDMSGKPGAKEKNIALAKALTSPAGRKAYLESLAGTIIDTDPNDLIECKSDSKVSYYASHMPNRLKACALLDKIRDAALLEGLDTKYINGLDNRRTVAAEAQRMLSHADFLSSPYFGTMDTSSVPEKGYSKKAISDNAKKLKALGIEPVSGGQYNHDLEALVTYKNLEKNPPSKDLINKEISYTPSKDFVPKLLSEFKPDGYVADYDNKIAEMNRIEAEYKSCTPAIDAFLFGLHTHMIANDLVFNSKLTMSSIRAFEVDKDGKLLQKDVFVEDSNSVIEPPREGLSSEEYDKNVNDRINRHTLTDNLSHKRKLEIYKMAVEGKLFFTPLGSNLSEAQQIYIQKDGAVGLNAWSSEGDLYNVNEDYRNKILDYQAKIMPATEEYVQTYQKSLENEAKTLNKTLEAKKAEGLKKLNRQWYFKGTEVTSRTYKLQEFMTSYGLTHEDVSKAISEHEKNFEPDLNTVKELAKDCGVKIRIPKDSDKRKELSLRASELTLKMSSDSLSSVTNMDQSLPGVRKIKPMRGLSAVFLSRDPGQKKNNEWFCTQIYDLLEEKEKCRPDSEELDKVNEKLQGLIDRKMDLLIGNCDERFLERMTDEELVNNIERMNITGSALFEMVNFRSECKQLGLPVNEETVQRGIDFYNKFGAVLAEAKNRFSLISSPYYAYLDMAEIRKYPDFIQALEDQSNNELHHFGAVAAPTDFHYRCNLELPMLDYVSEKLSSDEHKYSHPEIKIYDKNCEVYDLSGEFMMDMINNKSICCFTVPGSDEIFALKLTDQKPYFADVSATAEGQKQIQDVSKFRLGEKYLENIQASPNENKEKANGKGLQDECGRLLDVVSGADSMFIRSSSEFAAIKSDLKKISGLNKAPDPVDSKLALKNIAKNCRLYLNSKDAKKLNGATFNNREIARYSAIREVYESTMKSLDCYRPADERAALPGIKELEVNKLGTVLNVAEANAKKAENNILGYDPANKEQTIDINKELADMVYGQTINLVYQNESGKSLLTGIMAKGKDPKETFLSVIQSSKQFTDLSAQGAEAICNDIVQNRSKTISEMGNFFAGMLVGKYEKRLEAGAAEVVDEKVEEKSIQSNGPVK